MKRGQITIFIILGLLILLAIGVATYLYGKQAKAPFEPTPKLGALEPALINEYVSSCLKKVAQEGIYLIAAQGGYVNPKGDHLYGEEGDGLPVQYHLENGLTTYAVNRNSSAMRPLDEMMTALNKYIAVELPHCLDFSDFERQGFTVHQPKIDWQAIEFNFSNATVGYSFEQVRIASIPRIESGDVAVTAIYPLVFKNKDETIKVTDFFATVPLRLSLLHKIATRLAAQIVQAQKAPLFQTYLIHQHCNEYASTDRLVNIYTTWTPYAQDYLVKIVDAQPTTAGKAPFKLQFAVRNANIFGACVG